MEILIAEDEKSIGITLRDDLQEAGYPVQLCFNGKTAEELLEIHSFDLAILDINMPGYSGLDLLKIWKRRGERLKIILITAFGTIESAVEAMKLGAYDFLTKPFMNEQVLQRVRHIESLQQLTLENEQLKIERGDTFYSMVGRSKAMCKVFDTLKTLQASPINSTVLIQGPSGSGKELTARSLHYGSPRKEKPFVTVSCGTLSESLLEDTLFGHEKGAFTDAKELRIGKFEQAHQGTIFLDDIDDMSLQTQVKLLRVLQEREIERLGSSQTLKVDVRVISATKIDLLQAVHEKKFREDLYYRLHIVKIILPPLQDRREDIPFLIKHFIKKHGMSLPFTLAPDILQEMCHLPWNGNIRELEASIERAIIMSAGDLKLKKEHLFMNLGGIKEISFPLRNLKEVALEAERLHIQKILKYTQGHKAKTAEILGISRKNLWEKMKEFHLS
jgi:two-component system NtrC family response regulator